MNRSALILGTLHGQNEAITLLKAKGWTVHACGHRREGPGVTSADSFHLIDILDHDAVAALASELNVTCLYSVGSDIAMPTVAAVSERLGLPCFHDTRITRTLFRKDLFRTFLDSTDIPTVPWKLIQNESDLQGFNVYPAILKPVDSQGQRGILKVMNAEEGAQRVKYVVGYSRSRCCIIEQWMDGPEFSVHAFVEHGTMKFFMPSDRHVWSGPLIGIAEAHEVPSAVLSGTHSMEVRVMMEKLIRHLGIVTGPLYAQLKLTAAGARFIEVASRLDGCHLWRLMKVHTGVDLLEACFDSLAGLGWTQQQRPASDRRHALRFCLGSPSADYSLWEADHVHEPNIIYCEKQVDHQGRVRDTNGVVGRIGYHIEVQ